MSGRSYLGIDINQHNEWTVALLAEGKIGLLRRYKNTSAELAALAGFVGEHCARPKICLRPTSRAALRLLKFIGDIPGVEVVLMSEAGFNMHRAWMTPPAEAAAERGDAGQAMMLARCAERMI